MASFDGNSRLQTPAIGDKPHQPSSFRFPKREFGNTLVSGSTAGHGYTMRKT